MTGLAAQLSALAAPSSNIFDVERRKVSLLFDEADTLDREKVLAIGVSGLEELISLEPSFSSYRKTLFADVSQNVQRATMSKEASDKIGETIKGFLYRLIPFMKLEPARQALEWLVYRYETMSYERVTILRVALIYHDDNMFKRLLYAVTKSTVTPLSSDPTYGWMAKSVNGLTRKTLITRCRRHPTFLTNIIALISDASEMVEAKYMATRMNTLYTFVASVTLGVLHYGEVDNQIVSILMPHIARGLTSSTEPERQCWTLILCALVRCVQLTQDTLDSVLSIVIKSIRTDASQWTTLTVLCQTHNVSAMPSKPLHKLAKYSEIADVEKVVENLSKTTDLTSLCEAVLKTESRNANANMAFLQCFVQPIIASEKSCKRMTSWTLKKFAIDDFDFDKMVKKLFKPIVKALLLRYPSSFDKVMEVWSDRPNWPALLKAADIKEHEIGLNVKVEKRELETDTIMDTVVMPQAKRLKLDAKDEELEDIDGKPLAVFQDGVREGDEEKVKAALSHMSEYHLGTLEVKEKLVLADALFTRCLDGKCKADEKIVANVICHLPLKAKTLERALKQHKDPSTVQLALRFTGVSDVTESTVCKTIKVIGSTVPLMHRVLLGCTTVTNTMVESMCAWLCEQRKHDLLPLVNTIAAKAKEETVISLLPVFARMCTEEGIDDDYIYKLLDTVTRQMMKAIPASRLDDVLEKLFKVYSSIAVHRLPYILHAIVVSVDDSLPTVCKTLLGSTCDERACFKVVVQSPHIRQMEAVDVVLKMDMADNNKLREQAALLTLHVLQQDRFMEMIHPEDMKTLTTSAASILKTCLVSLKDNPKSKSMQAVVQCLRHSLPITSSLSVMSSLMSIDDDFIQSNTVELLNVRLQEQPSPFNKTHIPPLVAIARSLCAWLSPESPKYTATLAKLAANSLRLFVRVLRDVDMDLLREICQKCTSVVHIDGRSASHRSLIGNAALCAAECITIMQVHAVALLPQFVDDLIHVCKAELTGETDKDGELVNGVPLSELFTSSILTTLCRVVCAVSQYTSTQLPQLIRLLCEVHKIDAPQNVTHKVARQQIIDRLTTLEQRIATIDSRALVQAIEGMTNTDDWHLRSFICRILQAHLTLTSFENKKSSHLKLLKRTIEQIGQIIFNVLPLREACADTMSSEEIATLESPVVSAMTQAVLKSSEETVRPLMQQIEEWYMSGLEDRSHVHRIVTAYRLGERMCAELKGLFVLFAPRFCASLPRILERSHLTNATKDKCLFTDKSEFGHADVLATAALNLLANAAPHMTVDKELLTLLAAHLNNTRATLYAERMAGAMLDCVQRVANGIHDDDALLRAFNYEILMNTRHKKSSVRLAALSCASALLTSSGSSAAALLPETVPFLSELFEDDDSAVQVKCHALVKQFEDAVGEKVEKYL